MITLKKLTRAKAIELASKGTPIILCPNKSNPYFMDGALTIEVGGIGSALAKPERTHSEFTQTVKYFKYYNCNAETGHHVSYYVNPLNIK